ncbi:bifunctional diguanylate cyclase/phosphohydrolase [Halanaerobaculum tunisiense]
MDDQYVNLREMRQNKLTDYVAFSYILSLLLLGLIFVKFIVFNNSSIIVYNFFLVSLFFLFTYLVSRYISNKTILDFPTKKDYFIFSIFITVISFAIYNSVAFNKHFLKVYYLSPIILATVNYGQRFGLLTAGYSTLNLVVLSYSLQDFSYLDYDIIFIILFFWIAWLIGGFIDLERRMQKHLEKMAITDSLTGLPNHANFQQTLNQWLNKAKEKQVSLSLALLDLDNFKHFNDALGHQKGDELLKSVANLVQAQIEEDVFFARCGGDEFAFLFFDYQQQVACKKVNQIKNKIQDNLTIPYEEFLEESLTFSLGIASFPQQAQTKKELIDMADYALYQVKTTQKDQVKIYHQVLNELAAENENSEEELFDSVRTLLNIINAKDRYTYGHSERVADYVKKFAEALELSSEEKKKLTYGAFLHDIGKIEVGRDILMKPDRLDQSEWETIKQHPETGAQILSPLKSSPDILAMARYHHENFDGTGYPEGLKGSDIPFYARVLRIIDSFDAMTSKRPYSPALSKEKALKELKEGANEQYDPHLVKFFIKVADENILLT